MPTILPALSARQLALLDVLETTDATVDIAPKGLTRRLKKARKTTLKQMETDHKILMKALHEKKHVTTSNAELERDKNILHSLGVGSGFMTRAKSTIPWHSTSISSSSVLNPILTHGSSRLSGPLLGVDAINGVPFHYDAWAPYKAGMVTSVNGMIAGMMGSGKSMCMKTLALREISYGRHVIIEGDPKTEWARIAHTVGGQVISAGNGAYLNPLDTGVKPDAYTDDEWKQEVITLRVNALRSLASAIRPDTPLSMAEQATIDSLTRVVSTMYEQPTITHIVSFLDSDQAQDMIVKGLNKTALADTILNLILIFNRMVDGALKGAFEKTSTVSIDPSKPLIVFDTGSIDDTDEVKKAMYTAAMSAAIDRLCYTRDGIFRLVIAEEGWSLLSNPELVVGWDKRMRLSGEFGVSNWLLIHELTDLDAFANKGTALRQMIEGILTKSETMILYRQSSNSREALSHLIPDITAEELDVIDKLTQGVGLWRVGSTLRQAVHPIVSQSGYDLFNTSAGRAG
ncbi:ATP-binding protein [Alloscardovia theropitheci]|nr:ATP-binding protein [Alloscardovia theropitheci]